MTGRIITAAQIRCRDKKTPTDEGEGQGACMGSLQADLKWHPRASGVKMALLQYSRNTDAIPMPQMLVYLLCHLGADLLPEQINRHGFAIPAETPIGPAITAWGAF